MPGRPATSTSNRASIPSSEKARTRLETILSINRAVAGGVTAKTLPLGAMGGMRSGGVPPLLPRFRARGVGEEPRRRAIGLESRLAKLGLVLSHVIETQGTELDLFGLLSGMDTGPASKDEDVHQGGGHQP